MTTKRESKKGPKVKASKAKALANQGNLVVGRKVNPDALAEVIASIRCPEDDSAAKAWVEYVRSFARLGLFLKAMLDEQYGAFLKAMIIMAKKKVDVGVPAKAEAKAELVRIVFGQAKKLEARSFTEQAKSRLAQADAKVQRKGPGYDGAGGPNGKPEYTGIYIPDLYEDGKAVVNSVDGKTYKVKAIYVANAMPAPSYTLWDKLHKATMASAIEMLSIAKADEAAAATGGGSGIRFQLYGSIKATFAKGRALRAAMKRYRELAHTSALTMATNHTKKVWYSWFTQEGLAASGPSNGGFVLFHVPINSDRVKGTCPLCKGTKVFLDLPCTPCKGTGLL